MTTVSGSHRVYAFWNRHRKTYVMYIIYLSRSIHGRRAYYLSTEGRNGWERLFRLCGWVLDHAHACYTRWVERPIAVRICGTRTKTRRESDGPCAS
jgi:hypothetical protein